MASLIAWLDASRAQQQKVQEFIQQFTDHGSLDDLGIGQIRDALSDALFPGTSTLHTRARYALFIPWCFQLSAQNKNPQRKADQLERSLIEPLHKSGDTEGLIGATAGISIKNLPSTMYWSFLRYYGILADPSLTLAQAQGERSAIAAATHTDAQLGVWHHSLPPAPEGFPHDIPGGFSLRTEEAQWLQERILERSPGTLLSHLATHAPSPDSRRLWEDPAVAKASPQVRDLVRDAQAFSAILHGAQLLYNLILAQAYDQDGYTAIDSRQNHFHNGLNEWATNLPSHVNLEQWEMDEFLTRLQAERRISVKLTTREFVTAWFGLLRSVGPHRMSTDKAASALIARRERQTKGSNARLVKQSRLAQWSGSSGLGALDFRWQTVNGLLQDVHAGLNRAEESADA